MNNEQLTMNNGHVSRQSVIQNPQSAIQKNLRFIISRKGRHSGMFLAGIQLIGHCSRMVGWVEERNPTLMDIDKQERNLHAGANLLGFAGLNPTYGTTELVQ